jgi:hypothetical protein
LLGNQEYQRDTTAEASRQSACFVQRIRQSEVCEGMRATAEPPSPLHQATIPNEKKAIVEFYGCSQGAALGPQDE